MLEVKFITQHKQHTFKFKSTIDNPRIFVDIAIYIYTHKRDPYQNMSMQIVNIKLFTYSYPGNLRILSYSRTKLQMTTRSS